jgi:Meckel syndrome type 1 protein
MTWTKWPIRSRALLAVCLILMMALSALPARAQMVQGSAEIKALTGAVEVLRRGQTAWGPARVGGRLVEGDEIRTTGGAFAELELADKSSLLLAEQSRLQVAKLVIDPQQQSRLAIFHLGTGKVRAAIATAAIQLVQARQSNFVISTPTGVAASRGTIKVVTYNHVTQTTTLAVFQGSAFFADRAGVRPVLVSVNTIVTQVANNAPSIPVTIPPAARPAINAPTNPGAPSVLTAPAPPPPTVPATLTLVVTAAIKAAPAEAPAVAAGVIGAAPEAAAQVTTAAVQTAPTQAAAIAGAAVAAAPSVAVVIAANAVNAAPAAAVSVTTAVVQAAPAQAAALAGAIALAAPAQAALIAQAAATSAPPAAAAAIASAVVTAVPTAAPAIAAAVVTAVPGAAPAIAAAAAAAAPAQAAQITQAAAVVAPPPAAPAIAAAVQVVNSTLGQDIQQSCASPPCP